MEEFNLKEIPKTAEVAYKDNHSIPVIILAGSLGDIDMWEYNPTEYKWLNKSDRLDISSFVGNIIIPYIRSYENIVIIIYRITLDKHFKFLFLITNLDDNKKKYIKEFEPSPPLITPPTSYTLVMNDLYITYNKNVIKLEFEKENYNFECNNYSFNNLITNAVYIPDKDFPYMLFVTCNTYNGKACELMSVLSDMNTVVSDSFNLYDEIVSVTYNDGIILASIRNGVLYQINPLTKKYNKIDYVKLPYLLYTYHLNNHILFIKSDEPYVMIDAGIYMEQKFSFHAFPTDRTITHIYSENECNIIVESDERNQKIYNNNTIIGYCNKNSRINLPFENNIKYYDNDVNHITIEYINNNKCVDVEIEEEKKETMMMNGDENMKISRNSILINNKNKLKICGNEGDDDNNDSYIIYSQIIGDYLYCITSDYTISKWKYDKYKETFSLEYSKKINNNNDNNDNDNNCKVTYADGNKQYLCIYTDYDTSITVHNINCFDIVDYYAKIKPITVLYIDDFNQIYTGNNMGMVKKFEFKFQNQLNTL